MSSPTPTPPAAPENDFDPLVFWIQYRQKIILFIGMFLVAMAVYFGSEFLVMQKREASARSFSQAKDADGWRKVIAQYSGTAAAGDAYLLLAEQLRKEGKLDESAATLREFIDKNPEHPLLSGAWTSLGATLEAQGKTDEALSTYQKVSTTYATSFSVPVALLGQARIFKEKGKADEAKRLYEQVISQFQETIFAQLAMRETQQMMKAAPATPAAVESPAAKAAPAPATPPPATPPPPAAAPAAPPAPDPAAQ